MSTTEQASPTVTLFWSDQDRICGAWVLVIKRSGSVTRTILDGPDHPDDQAGAVKAAQRAIRGGEAR